MHTFGSWSGLSTHLIADNTHARVCDLLQVWDIKVGDPDVLELACCLDLCQVLGSVNIPVTSMHTANALKGCIGDTWLGCIDRTPVRTATLYGRPELVSSALLRQSRFCDRCNA